MSNSDDLKPQSPPTLLGTEPDGTAAGQTRILASLEGRVSPAGKPPRKTGRRVGVVAAVAVIGAGAVAWAMLGNVPEHDAPLQASAPAAPAKADVAAPANAGESANASAAATASAPGVSVIADAAAATPAAIVDDTARDRELDRLGKLDGSTAAAAAAGLGAGALTLAALTPSPAKGKSALLGDSASSANNKSNKKVTDKKATATQEPSARAAAVASKDKAQAKTNTKSTAKAGKATKRKGGDDPDAEVLAALLLQPEGVPFNPDPPPSRKTRQRSSTTPATKAQ